VSDECVSERDTQGSRRRSPRRAAGCGIKQAQWSAGGWRRMTMVHGRASPVIDHGAGSLRSAASMRR
jgi:hypothetical protein